VKLSSPSTNFLAMDIAKRSERLRTALRAAQCDALLVTRRPNVQYLTGFTGSAGVIFFGPDELVLVTDGRYQTQANEQLEKAGVLGTIEITGPSKTQEQIVSDLASQYSKIGLESEGVTWAEQQKWAKSLGANKLVSTNSVIEALRLTKEPAEVERIRAACSIADTALRDLLPMLATSPTEREFAMALEVGMRQGGASGISFDSIVASGPNGAKPHARPSDRAIKKDELVVIDFGCVVDGYCSDMTRTVSVDDPGPKATRLWSVVQESQAAGRSAVRAGVSCREVDRACRDIIDNAGWGNEFSHGTGHGVGLEIHEAPRVSYASDEVLEAGYIVTVEPGVYLPGVGGVRLEDTVVVTENGCEALTEFPKFLTAS